MTFIEAKAVCEALIKAKANILIKGQYGKTSLCAAVAKNASIIHDQELSDLNLLRSLASHGVVIVENLTVKGREFLLPYLSDISTSAVPINAVFLITTNEDITIKDCAVITLDKITPEHWILWARQNHIHPAVIEMIENDPPLFDRKSPKILELLSKLLDTKPDKQYLPLLIGAYADEFKEALLKSLTRRESAAETISAYENSLIDMVANRPDKENETLFLEYVQKVAPRDALTLIKRLLSGAKTAEIAGKALKDTEIQKEIDHLLAALNR
ncbi:MAG: hypothetical protein LBE89_07305 [Helicobacteraceae bacterium]|jgi:hypothetical protein|nr:hypothetical protein [Helicobacteraceae bacterium]